MTFNLVVNLCTHLKELNITERKKKLQQNIPNFASVCLTQIPLYTNSEKLMKWVQLYALSTKQTESIWT